MTVSKSLGLSRVFLASILVFTGVCDIPNATATSFIALPLSETVRDNATIVRGKVNTGGVADWVKKSDGGRTIYTYYDLQVIEVFKGSVKAATIQIREIGGEKEGMGMQVAGAAQFKPGEDVVVMLSERNPDGSYDIQGLMAGKFGVRQDPASGKDYLVGLIGDDELSPAESGTNGEPPPPRRWTLDDLRKVVASQVSVSPKPVSSQIPANLGSAQGSSPLPKPTAPQLHSLPSQGATGSGDDQSRQDNSRGSSWIFWAAAVLLVGLLGIRMATRKRN